MSWPVGLVIRCIASDTHHRHYDHVDQSVETDSRSVSRDRQSISLRQDRQSIGQARQERLDERIDPPLLSRGSAAASQSVGRSVGSKHTSQQQTESPTKNVSGGAADETAKAA
eukprot:Selendium_serpulae@DN7760_c0_g1_i1.p2